MDEKRGAILVIPERQAMIAGLSVAAITAALYLVLVAVHLVSESTLTYAIVLAILMSACAWSIALMFSGVRADTENISSSFSSESDNASANVGQGPLSADEEEHLISQLEIELDVLEKRYRRELTAMQDAVRKSAGPSDERGRSQWGHE